MPEHTLDTTKRQRSQSPAPARAGGGTPQHPASMLSPRGHCACGGSCPRCRKQAEWRVGAPHDRYEQEAGRVATAVVGGTMSLATGDAIGKAPNILQRKATDATTSEPDLDAQLDEVRGGAPLAQPLRQFYEQRFGYDFGDVRLHTGGAAANAAQSIAARAYTTGRDIVFANGEFAPHTPSRQHLLAHELIHVVQQGVAPPLKPGAYSIKQA